jgi:hypothetical protein
MSDKLQKMGRIALREEGTMWNAYYALPDTIEGALFIGSIAMSLVQREDRKQAFISLIRECVADIIEEKFGQRPTFPDGVIPAPEHERTRE